MEDFRELCFHPSDMAFWAGIIERFDNSFVRAEPEACASGGFQRPGSAVTAHSRDIRIAKAFLYSISSISRYALASGLLRITWKTGC